MADLEAVLADVSYLMAMEKSKSTPAARASRKIVLPDHRYVALHFKIVAIPLLSKISQSMIKSYSSNLCSLPPIW